MNYVVVLSVVALVVLLGLYLYWTFREEVARPDRVRWSFFPGLALFGGLFVVLTVDTLRTIPERTHSDRLTPEVVAGKKVWQKYVCIDCHTILGNGAYYAPDLTKVWDRFLDRTERDPERARTALATFLLNPPQSTSDRRGMTNFHMSREEAQSLVEFFQWVSGIDTNGWPPPPLRPIARRSSNGMHPLSEEGLKGKTLFADLGCDGCHSIGGGDIVGPDLLRASGKYDRTTLIHWIQDPQGIYRALRRKPLNSGFPEMPTLAMTPGDADALVEYLTEAAAQVPSR